MSTETGICRNCGQPLKADGRCPRCDSAGHSWTLQDWRPLLQLGLVIALSFSFTRLVVNFYNDQCQAQSNSFFAAGTRAMDAQHPEQAINAFEGALIYSHDNFQYQLRLTDALLASGATSEAVAQLHAFLDQRPGDAQVNLKLARLEARRHHVDEALRYYLAAIEGDWPEHTDPFPQRIAVRFESAEYLLDQGRKEQAEGALRALAAVLPVAWPEQTKLADMFMRNGDPARALSVYQAQLNLDSEDEAALLGAAKASLLTASYGAARRYLLAVKPPNDESRSLLAQLDRMEQLDPFAHGATEAVRVQRTMAVFRIAAGRLAACGARAGKRDAKAEQRWSELQRWGSQLAPEMNERRLRGRDDLIESTMRFAFQSEIAAESGCGEPSLDDESLLLLARERLGALR